MRADMVVVDLAEIGDRQRMRDQLRIVVAGRRRRLRRLQPAQLPGLAQQRGRDRTKGGLGGRDRLLGAHRVFGDDDLELGQCGGKARAPFARFRRLRRQHQELCGHRQDPPSGKASMAELPAL